MLSFVRTVPWRRCLTGRPVLRSTQHASFTTAASASSASHSSTSSSAYQTPSAQLAALAAAESTAAAGVKPPRPQPTARYAVKSNRLAEECYHTPTTPKLRTKGEFEQLLKKGHDGEKYDMIACWHLGNIYFDGVVGPSGTTATDAATTRVSTAASTPAASIPSNDTASSSNTADIASPFTFASETPIQPEAALSDESPLNLPKNYTQSLLWFTNAAFEGHVPSRTKLGVMYLAGYGIKRNIPIAFELFTESSNFGDRDAMAHLAAMYLQGIGAPTKDVAKAIEWYTKAAERGHVRAQAILAKLLNSPESGSSRNPSLALHWLNESARQGHVESLFLLGERASDESTKFDWYMKAAKLGHAQSQYWIGLSYLNSSPLAVARLPSLDDRYIEARRYFSEAVEAGNVHAQARLGFMMWHGIGGKVDKSNGIMWLNNAAEAVRSTQSEEQSNAADMMSPTHFVMPFTPFPLSISICQNHVDVQLLLGSIAYDEYVDTHSPNDPIDEEDKKMQTAKHYFGKVLENANRHVRNTRFKA